MTKVLASTVAMMLVDAKVLNLEAPVSTYIPSFKVAYCIVSHVHVYACIYYIFLHFALLTNTFSGLYLYHTRFHICTHTCPQSSSSLRLTSVLKECMAY